MLPVPWTEERPPPHPSAICQAAAVEVGSVHEGRLVAQRVPLHQLNQDGVFASDATRVVA